MGFASLRTNPVVDYIGACVVCKLGIFSDQQYGRAPRPLLGKAHAGCVSNPAEPAAPTPMPVEQAAPQPAPRTGECSRCGRTRKLYYLTSLCHGCHAYTRWHRATGLQTILPPMLHAGDTLVRDGAALHVLLVQFAPCEVAPVVEVATVCAADGAHRTLRLPADEYVAVTGCP